MNEDEYYYCVGVCMADPDSGYCLGCGRPPMPLTSEREAVVAELASTLLTPSTSTDPDTPPDA